MSQQSFTTPPDRPGPAAKRNRNNLTKPMVARACSVCAKKKARCSGGVPCEGCMQHGYTCDYIPMRRRGPKFKSRPPTDPHPLSALLPHIDNETHLVEPLVPHQQPQQPHLSIGAMDTSPPPILAISPILPQRDFSSCSDSDISDSGSLVTDRVLHAEGPGISYYMDILPRDMATTEPQSHAMTPMQNRPSDILNRRRIPSPDGGAIDLDLARLADHPDAIKGLYHIYWCFVHPSWPVIYRPSYDQLNAPIRYPLLHNAIMSCCCRLDLDRQSRDMPPNGGIPGLNADNVRVIGDFFFDRAKEHLQKTEAGGGDIITVQALLIMTIRELGQNRSRSAWAYSGQAIRLALYLNLHSDGAQPSGVVFKEEEKRRVIWECYVIDKYISIIMGKPFSLRGENIETPLPSITESDEYAMWDADVRMVVPGIASRFDGVRCRTVSNLNAWIKLTMTIERILDGIPSSKRKVGQRAGSSIKELDEALVIWLKQAGDNYIETPTLSVPPHMLLLKLWYYCCLILVHRRHMKGTTTFYRDGKAVASHTICVDAANGICETVRVMEESYGLYRFPSAVVFIIFQAGIIHLSNCAAADAKASRLGRDSLEQCIWWLDQIAGTYRISPAYCSVLSKLEELSRRELRNQHEVAAVLASRIGTRSNTPTADLGMMLDGIFSVAEDHHNRTLSQSIHRYSIPMPDIVPNGARDLTYNQFEGPSTAFAFDPSRTLDDTPVFPDTSLLYGHLHETFFSEMPINLPSSTDDMSDWNTFQADYASLLDNQSYDNQR